MVKKMCVKNWGKKIRVKKFGVKKIAYKNQCKTFGENKFV